MAKPMPDPYPPLECLDPECREAVTIQLAGRSDGYCRQHRTKAYSYNRGMA